MRNLSLNLRLSAAVITAVLMISEASYAALSCELVQSTPEVISRIPTRPSFFTKVHADGKMAFYIGRGNHLLFLESHDPETRDIRIPGNIDPVPSSDGKIVTIPGLKFYLMDEILESGIDADPLFSDSTHGGVYQSVAVINEDEDKTTYRVITDVSGEINYRDYEIDFSSQGRPKFKKLGSVQQLCPGQRYKTIMISKTGKYVGVYDPAEGTSKLVSGDGECREVLDLGYPTGKIEFSFDDSRIAFHVDYFDMQAGGYFSGVSNVVSKDVLVMDINETEEGMVRASNLRRLSATLRKGSGTYYPSFDKFGRISYVYDDNNQFSFHVVDPDDLFAYEFFLPAPSSKSSGVSQPQRPANWKARLHAASALGSLWAQECGIKDALELTAVDAATTFLSISQSDCRELVGSSWERNSDEISNLPRFSRDPRFDAELVAGLTSEQLLNSCKDNHTRIRETRTYGKVQTEIFDGPRVIHNYCVGCHDGTSLRLENGDTVSNPIDFSHLNETQILASIARIELEEGHKKRMPPGRSYFAPVFELQDGTDIDHRQVALDYLKEKLAESKAPVQALEDVEAPDRFNQCYDSESEWVAYRDHLAFRLSVGDTSGLKSAKSKIGGCNQKLEDLGLQGCFANLKKYAAVKTLGRFGRRLGFEIKDEDYYNSIKTEALQLPSAADGIDLSDGFPENWKEIVEEQVNVRALQYRSRTVINPGNTGVKSVNRLLFLVEGEKYDRWIQFTLPEPNTSPEGTLFDPTGLADGSGPQQLVDFIVIDKSDKRNKIYFGQFWRNSEGKDPSPRNQAFHNAYFRGDPRADEQSRRNESDTCYSCHPNGMRQLSPQPSSVLPDSVVDLEYFNTKMASYGKLDWNGAVSPESYGPPRGEKIGCAACHNNGGSDRSPVLSRGPITTELFAGHLDHKITGDMAMSPEFFTHDLADGESPIEAAAIVGVMKSINLLKDDMRIPLQKMWIDEQVSRSTAYPSVLQALDDLRDAGFFNKEFDELFAAPNPYLDRIPEYATLKSDAERLSDIRDDISARLGDLASYRLELGDWIKQKCEVLGEID